MEETLNKILYKLEQIEKRLAKIEKKNVDKTLSPKKKILKIKKSHISETKPSPIVKCGFINITKHPNVSRIPGDTFDKKHFIRECKGYWTPEIKGWTIKNKFYNDVVKKLEPNTLTLELKNSDIVIEPNENNSKHIQPIKKEVIQYGFISDSD